MAVDTDRFFGSGDLAALSLDRLGVLMKLIAGQWQLGGELPADLAQCAMAVSASEVAIRQAWPEIGHFFVVDGDVMYEPVTHERAIAKQELSAKRSAAGRSGGRPKGKKSNSFPAKSNSLRQPKANAFAVPPKNPPISNTPNPSDIGVAPSACDGGFAPICGNQLVLPVPDEPPVEIIAKPRKENAAFDPAERVLSAWHKQMSWDPVSPLDVKPHLRSTSALQLMIKEYGEAQTIAILVFAATKWQSGATVHAIHRQRNQLLQEMNGGRPRRVVTTDTEELEAINR